MGVSHVESKIPEIGGHRQEKSPNFGVSRMETAGAGGGRGGISCNQKQRLRSGDSAECYLWQLQQSPAAMLELRVPS